MDVISRCRQLLRSLWLRINRRSLQSHVSFWVSDLEQAQQFYQRLGFSPVTATRGKEVTMLRNARGDELNLVRASASTDNFAKSRTGSAAFPIGDLGHERDKIQSWYGPITVYRDAVAQRFHLLDPDTNIIEFYQPGAIERRTADIYLILTQTELSTGLSDHYFQPPTGDNRFVRAHHHSAFMEMAMQRVAEETQDVPWVVILDAEKLQTDEPLASEIEMGDIEFDKQATSSAYPLVYAPISQEALLSAGRCESDDGGYRWPSNFLSIADIPRA